MSSTRQPPGVLPTMGHGRRKAEGRRVEDGGLRGKLKLKPKLLAAINFNYGYNCRRVKGKLLLLLLLDLFNSYLNPGCFSIVAHIAHTPHCTQAAATVERLAPAAANGVILYRIWRSTQVSCSNRIYY